MLKISDVNIPKEPQQCEECLYFLCMAKADPHSDQILDINLCRAMPLNDNVIDRAGQDKIGINCPLFGLDGSMTRAERAGFDFGNNIIEIVNLMYQNRTALRFLSKLKEAIDVEYTKRIYIRDKEKVRK